MAEDMKEYCGVKLSYMIHNKLLSEDIHKICVLKRMGLTNREIQRGLGYSLSTISKYTSTVSKHPKRRKNKYTVNPGITRRSLLDEEILNYRRKMRESDPNLVEINDEINKLQKRIKDLEEAVNSLNKKLCDLSGRWIREIA